MDKNQSSKDTARFSKWAGPQADDLDAREQRAQNVERQERLLRPDGSSSVIRLGLTDSESGDLYHFLMTSSWARFFAAIFAAYVSTNTIFATLYWLVREELVNVDTFAEAFFFSVQTMASIGYGHSVPIGTAANLVVTVEAFVGMLAVSVGAGLMFARFTRPQAGVMFSERAVITTHDGQPMLMFRLANRRKAHIVEAHVYVVLAFDDVTIEGERLRRLVDLNLRRETSPSFVLSWTVRHVIDETSPLFGKSHEDLVAARAEILVVFSGFHESFNQTVHSRRAYAATDIRWNHKLVDIFIRLADGRSALDFTRFHETEPNKL
jgi:inward rectifier potassium channel